MAEVNAENNSVRRSIVTTLEKSQRSQKKITTFKFDNVTCRTGRLEENFGIDRMQHVDPSVTGEQLTACVLTQISVLGENASDVSLSNTKALTDVFFVFKPQNTKIE